MNELVHRTRINTPANEPTLRGFPAGEIVACRSCGEPTADPDRLCPGCRLARRDEKHYEKPVPVRAARNGVLTIPVWTYDTIVRTLEPAADVTADAAEVAQAVADTLLLLRGIRRMVV
jgi:hypothetical protein